MNKVASADGTTIAYERFGDGEPVILISAALCDRTATLPLAEQLAQRFSVINYDSRGRGDSGDTTPYAVEREIEDLGALIAEAGGMASVYGHSSGAGLGLHAAAHGLPITKLVLHEPPFAPGGGDEERQKSWEHTENIKRLVAQDRRGDAVELHMTAAGMPPEMVAQMREGPWWTGMEANAHTLPYDFEVVSDSSRGGATPVDQASSVTIPTLVLAGGASPAWMIDLARQIADAMPNGRHRVLVGQEHIVPPEVLAPVLMEFLADQ